MSKKRFTTKNRGRDYDWFERLGFDPYSEKFPEGMPSIYENIIYRSLAILSSRNKEEVCSAISVMHELNSLLDSHFSLGIALAMPPSQRISRPYCHSEALINCRGDVELTKITGIRGMPTWSELFASYALKMACDAVQYWKKTKKLYGDTYTADCATLTAVAEILNEKRQAGKKGGKSRKKLSEFDPIKIRCEEIWRNYYQNLTNRAAANKIVGATGHPNAQIDYGKQLTQIELSSFNTPEPEITVGKWIGVWKKTTKAKE